MRSPDMTGGLEAQGYPEPTDQGDVIDHPDHNLPHPMQPRAPQGVGMAGDVLPMPGEKSMGSGQTLKASGYYSGAKTDPKVTPVKKP